MGFTSSLKTVAQQIIELTRQLEDRAHTWNQEEFAPAGGFTDRAGFVVFDDVELSADVYTPEDEKVSILRARLAFAPKDKDEQERFTIVTLDFNVDTQKAQPVITDADNVNQQALLSLLNESDTTPKLIHVSLESGKDADGNNVGKRYEYHTEDIKKLTEPQQVEFLTTLRQAYEQIVSKI